MISQRARQALGAPSPLITAHFACARDPYDPATNPQGYINLGTAENYLMWDLLGPRLERIAPISEELTHYNELFGTRPFRERVAAFLGHTEPEAVVAAAGAAAVLEILAFVYAEPGEAFLVPAPYYSGFDNDLGARAGVRLIPVPATPTRAELEAALAGADRRVRGLLFSNPVNPLGTCMTEAQLRVLVAFARDHGLACIADEIYAKTVYGPSPHIPARSLDPRVDTVYGFAKDFALSGFKLGVALVADPQAREAARELAQYSAPSTLNQHWVGELLADGPWLEGFFAASRARLAERAARITAALDAMGVPYVRPEAGFFIWLDLRAWLGSGGEAELLGRLLAEGKLNLTPGSAFHGPEPGWFRACFARPEETLAEALRRLGAVLQCG